MKSSAKRLVALLVLLIVTAWLSFAGKNNKDNDNILRTGMSVDEAHKILEVAEIGLGIVSGGSAQYELVGMKHPDRVYLLRTSIYTNRLEEWSFRARSSNEHFPFLRGKDDRHQ